MKHYIIVKFKKNYDYKNELKNITKIFNETKEIDGVDDVKIHISNSTRENRFDLMIEMNMSNSGLEKYDISESHKNWKKIYSEFIESKTIFDCD